MCCYCSVLLFGASDLRNLVGWLGKGVRSGEGGEVGRNRREGWENSWEIRRCLFRVDSELVHAQRRKIAKSLGSGAGFLFVQTRHGPVTQKSLRTPPSRSLAFWTRAVAEEPWGVFIKKRNGQSHLSGFTKKEGTRVPVRGRAQHSLFYGYRNAISLPASQKALCRESSVCK